MVIKDGRKLAESFSWELWLLIFHILLSLYLCILGKREKKILAKENSCKLCYCMGCKQSTSWYVKNAYGFLTIPLCFMHLHVVKMRFHCRLLSREHTRIKFLAILGKSSTRTFSTNAAAQNKVLQYRTELYTFFHLHIYTVGTQWKPSYEDWIVLAYTVEPIKIDREKGLG